MAENIPFWRRFRIERVIKYAQKHNVPIEFKVLERCASTLYDGDVEVNLI